MQTNKFSDNDFKNHDLQKLKETLELEKNKLINDNIMLTTENKKLELQLQKVQNIVDTLKMENDGLQQKNRHLTALLEDIRGEIEKTI